MKRRSVVFENQKAYRVSRLERLINLIKTWRRGSVTILFKWMAGICFSASSFLVGLAAGSSTPLSRGDLIYISVFMWAGLVGLVGSGFFGED